MNDLKTTSWMRVRDYQDSPDSLAMEELRSLHGVWEEQKHKIQSGRSFAQFEIELKREWAIETGLIERLYTLDLGITQILITNGIVADFIPSNTSQNAKQIELLIKDHESALEHLFSFVKQVRELTPSYIKELHGLITSHQETCEAIDQFGQTVEVPLLRGEYKKQPNNPTRKNGLVHHYCPPEHVSAEMD
ncbi:MAG: Fic family protein, partial [Gammaproteobacteria bacterium]|nr:Fic family protein [Gammaproteobacteria bacterium]